MLDGAPHMKLYHVFYILIQRFIQHVFVRQHFMNPEKKTSVILFQPDLLFNLRVNGQQRIGDNTNSMKGEHSSSYSYLGLILIIQVKQFKCDAIS